MADDSSDNFVGGGAPQRSRSKLSLFSRKTNLPQTQEIHGAADKRMMERKGILSALRNRAPLASRPKGFKSPMVNAGMLKSISLRKSSKTTKKASDSSSAATADGKTKGNKSRKSSRLSLKKLRLSHRENTEFTIGPDLIVTDPDLLNGWVNIRYKRTPGFSWMVMGYEPKSTGVTVADANCAPRLLGYGGGELGAFQVSKPSTDDKSETEDKASSSILSPCNQPGWLYWIYARVQRENADPEESKDPTRNKFILIAFSKPENPSCENDLHDAMSKRYATQLAVMRKLFQHQLFIHAKNEDEISAEKVLGLLNDVHHEATLQLIIRTSTKEASVPFIVRIAPDETLSKLKERISTMLKWDQSEVHVMQLVRKGNLQCLKEASKRNIFQHNNVPAQSTSGKKPLAAVNTVTVVHLLQDDGRLGTKYRLMSGSKLFVEMRKPWETGPTMLEKRVKEGYSLVEDRHDEVKGMQALRKRRHLLRETSQVTGLTKVGENDFTALYIDSTSTEAPSRHEQLLRHLQKVAADHHTRLINPEDVVIHRDRPPLGDGRTARVREGLLLFHDDEAGHSQSTASEPVAKLHAEAFHDHRTGEHAVRVAVKMFSCRRVTDSVYAAFEEEVSRLCDLQHPNIVQMLGVYIDNPTEESEHEAAQDSSGIQDTMLMILYELMPRGSLKQLRTSDDWEGLPFDNKLGMITGAVKGIEYLHTAHAAPIIHRDIKSDNLLVDDDFKLKWGDFGISRSLKDGRAAQSIVGTSGWVAPEVLMESSDGYGKECDVYSLGIILWEMTCSKANPLAGLYGEKYVEALRQGMRPKFAGNPPVGCSTEAWKKYVNLTETCWKFDPNDRPTATEIVQELEAIAKLNESQET